MNEKHELVRGTEYPVIDAGKTKNVLETSDKDKVFLRNKPFLTKGDGEERLYLEEKDEWVTTTAYNCLRYLENRGILTHCIEKVDERTLKVWKLEMIPIELVARIIASGSFCKRHPEVKEGTIFQQPVIEFFLKDDARHDPMMKYELISERWLLYDAKKPLKEGFIQEMDSLTVNGRVIDGEIVKRLREIARIAFLHLKEAWEAQNVLLADYKVECGFRKGTGEIFVGDVIDGDCCRLWRDGKKENALDKQVYRDADKITAAIYEKLRENYRLVAEMTEKFL